MVPADPTTHGGRSVPGSTPRRPRRRINPDQAPFDRLPTVQADPADATIRG